MPRYTADHLEESAAALYKWSRILYALATMTSLVGSWRLVQGLALDLDGIGVGIGMFGAFACFYISFGLAAAGVSWCQIIALKAMRTAERDQAASRAEQSSASGAVYFSKLATRDSSAES